MRSKIIILLVFVTTFAKAQISRYSSKSVYYDASNQKHVGYISIDYTEDKITYKEGKGISSYKVRFSDGLKAVVIDHFDEPKDSLVVMSEDGNDDKKYFALPILTTANTSFYYKFKRKVVQAWDPGNLGLSSTPSAPGGSHMVIATNPALRMIPMYSDGGTTHELTKSNFRDVLSKAFADDADLVSQINEKNAKFKDWEDFCNQYIDFVASKKQNK